MRLLKSKNLRGISDCGIGLVQTVAENFDANISSQNGLQFTHALVLLLTQVQPTQSQSDQDNSGTNQIRRMMKNEMSEEILPDVPVQRYRRPHKPEMPAADTATRTPLPLKVLVQQQISVSRAKETDFLFMKSIVTKDGELEFNGYNSKNSREQGHTIYPATKAVYLSLLDRTPTEPDTMPWWKHDSLLTGLGRPI